MKLYLNNIGMLEEAEVTLKPLSIIAGENDNGKSTVGKIVFCLVKAINRYKEDLNESREYRVSEKFKELLFLLVMAAEDQGAKLPRELIEQIGSLNNFVKKITTNPSADINNALNIKEIVHNLFDGIDDNEHKDKAIKILFDINEIIASPENKIEAIKNAFNKVFASEFDASLLLQGADRGSIKLVKDDGVLVHLEVDRDNTVKLVGDVSSITLKDATFIDTPLIFNYHDLLLRSRTLLDIEERTPNRLGIPYTTLHTKDLFDKLIEPTLDELLSESDKTLLNEIEAEMEGKITYSKESKDFLFERDKQSISIKNTASGIKTFGLLHKLIANKFATKDTVIVFDEPENHLHPKWQLKLAQLLVELAKNKIYVMVSSHSPYMIEALKRYAELADLDEQTAFYLAEERRIENKDRLSDIFAVLAEPFEIFRQMDAEILKGE